LFSALSGKALAAGSFLFSALSGKALAAGSFLVSRVFAPAPSWQRELGIKTGRVAALTEAWWHRGKRGAIAFILIVFLGFIVYPVTAAHSH
jgi:hypothetical protein